MCLSQKKIDQCKLPFASVFASVYSFCYHSQGLDNLKARCLKYKAAGASFAKWRAVIQIRPAGPGVTALPSEAAIAAAARGLAMYAAICQSAGLVPIVEPEVRETDTHTVQQLHV